MPLVPVPEDSFDVLLSGGEKLACGRDRGRAERCVGLSMNDLPGFTIDATDGDIGRVDAFYFDDTSFTIRHLVIDTSGWLTGRRVLSRRWPSLPSTGTTSASTGS